ncbi:hypothetical protein [Ascidiimonas sp. W6]|uniref:hypothetical protein n=1 Tax=Ascidiimonas meishanensis TaxID=3128903 RepID=UPI0030EE3B26
MIIFGTSSVKSTTQSADFSCPQHKSQKIYRHPKANLFIMDYATTGMFSGGCDKEIIPAGYMTTGVYTNKIRSIFN